MMTFDLLEYSIHLDLEVLYSSLCGVVRTQVENHLIEESAQASALVLIALIFSEWAQ